MSPIKLYRNSVAELIIDCLSILSRLTTNRHYRPSQIQLGPPPNCTDRRTEQKQETAQIIGLVGTAFTSNLSIFVGDGARLIPKNVNPHRHFERAIRRRTE